MRRYLAIALSVALVLLGFDIVRDYPSRSVHAASSFATIICDQFKPISVSANAQLVTAGGPNAFIYICGYNLTNGNAAAQSASLVEGTGATCGTNTQAVVGNSTAAGGLAMGISGSVNLGGGNGAVAKTIVAGDNLCLFTAAGPIGGVLAWTTSTQ